MFRIIILFILLPIFSFGAKMDSILAMNLLFHKKLEVSFKYDGDLFQLTSKKLDLKINASRMLLARNAHLTVSEQEKVISRDTVIVKGRVFYKIVRPYEFSNDIGITEKRTVYELRTVYSGMIYNFELLDISNISEYEKIALQVMKKISFFGNSYSENPNFGKTTTLNAFADNLNDEEFVTRRILSQKELFQMLLADITSEDEKQKELANLPISLYDIYLEGTLDVYKSFYAEIDGRAIKCNLISSESVLINEGLVQSSDFPEINNTNEIAVEVAFAVEVGLDKYNVGMVLLGINNPKLLSFMYEKY